MDVFVALYCITHFLNGKRTYMKVFSFVEVLLLTPLGLGSAPNCLAPVMVVKVFDLP